MKTMRNVWKHNIIGWAVLPSQHSFIWRRLWFAESLRGLHSRAPRGACGVEGSAAPGPAGLGSPFPRVGRGSQTWRAAQMQDRSMDLLAQQIVLQQWNALSRKTLSLFLQKETLYFQVGIELVVSVLHSMTGTRHASLSIDYAWNHIEK